MPAEHAFAPYVRALGKGKLGSRSLRQDEAFDAISMILQQQVEPEQLGAFLMLLRVKKETLAELAGFVAAVISFHNYSSAKIPGIAVDIERDTPDQQLDPERLRLLWRDECDEAYGEAGVLSTLACCLVRLGQAHEQNEGSQLATIWWQNRNRLLI